MMLSYLSRFSLIRHQKLLILIGLTLLTYYAAMSRFHVFPWVLASLLLSSLVCSFAFPRWLIRNIAVSRTGIDKAVENESIIFNIKVTNLGLMPRFMIQVTDKLPFILSDMKKNEHDQQVLSVVAYIGIGKTHDFKVSVKCEKRGLYQLGPIGISTSFPFGLIEARSHKNEGIQSLTIYPEIFPIISLPLLGTPSEIHKGGFFLPKGTGSAEFSGIREYRRGDNPRHIHWPTTARTNQLMIKEFEPLASASLHIILDQSKIANVGIGKHASFEYAVRIAASICRYATNNNMSITLSPQAKSSTFLNAGSGEYHYRAILDYLAVIDADGELFYSSVIHDAALTISYGQTAVIFLSEPESRIAETIQSIAFLKSQGANVLVIDLDRDSFLGTKPTKSHSPWLSIFDLDIQYIQVKKGDQLANVFNL